MYVLCYYTLHSSGFAALPLIKFSSSTDHEIMLGATPDESVALQTLVRTSYRRHRFTMYVLCYYTLHLLGFATLPLIKFSSSTDHEIMLGATPDERVALQTLVRTAYRGTCGRARSPHNLSLGNPRRFTRRFTQQIPRQHRDNRKRRRHHRARAKYALKRERSHHN